MIADVLNARILRVCARQRLGAGERHQELMQHYVLASLSRAGMFSEAIFHGGTCLRIIHGMSRFSEDLDFLLKRPDPGFRWKKYLRKIRIKLEIDTNSGPRLTPCYVENTSKAAAGMTLCGTPPGKSSPTSSFCKTRCFKRGRGRDGLWK